MNLKMLKKQLRKEREILNKLVDEALENGTPISRTQTIIEQSQKVDHIIENMQSEINKKRKPP